MATKTIPKKSCTLFTYSLYKFEHHWFQTFELFKIKSVKCFLTPCANHNIKKRHWLAGIWDHKNKTKKDLQPESGMQNRFISV